MDEVTPEVMSAMSFARTLARDYADGGGDPVDLIGAYAGLVAESDGTLAARCLGALEEALEQRRPG